MSFAFTKAAWAIEGLSQTQKSVIVRLAWYADIGRTVDVFPSINSIARDCAIKSRRTVQSALSRLQSLGMISIQPNAGPNGTNAYVLNLAVDRTDVDEPEGKMQVVTTVQQMHPPQQLHPAANAPKTRLWFKILPPIPFGDVAPRQKSRFPECASRPTAA